MNNISKNIKSAYNKSATIYNDFVESEISHNSLAETPFVQQLMGKVKGLRILDICCGAGRYSIWMAQNGAHVTGIDFSEKLIELGRDKIKDTELNIEFVHADIEDVGFLEGEQYDGIICGMAIEYLSDIKTLFYKLSKIIKPKGWFIISSNHPIRNFGDYIYDENNNVGRSVFDYFNKKSKNITWRMMEKLTGEKFEVQHYPYNIEDVVNALSDAEFLVQRILEPAPIQKVGGVPKEMYKKIMCCPQFIIYKAIKQ